MCERPCCVQRHEWRKQLFVSKTKWETDQRESSWGHEPHTDSNTSVETGECEEGCIKPNADVSDKTGRLHIVISVWTQSHQFRRSECGAVFHSAAYYWMDQLINCFNSRTKEVGSLYRTERVVFYYLNQTDTFLFTHQKDSCCFTESTWKRKCFFYFI